MGKGYGYGHADAPQAQINTTTADPGRWDRTTVGRGTCCRSSFFLFSFFFWKWTEIVRDLHMEAFWEHFLRVREVRG